MNGSTVEGKTVMADAQFGVTRILRPPSGFEAIYQGQPATTPIYLFQNGDPLDPFAGQAGYDPNLIAGLSVPFGARLALWIPNIFYVDDDVPPVFPVYEWIFIWRLRNVFDFRNSPLRIPYHFPQVEGPIDTSFVPAQARVTLPAAYNTITYIQPEPVSATLPDSLRAVQKARAEDIKFGTVALSGPLLDLALTEGVVQQGVQDPGVTADAIRPRFMVHEVQALGDELIVAVRRSATNVPNWGFAGVFPANADVVFSQILGNGTGQEFPFNGVYVMPGTSP
jgi:hypothetical protein